LLNKKPGRAGREAHGRAGPRRYPRKFWTFGSPKTQNSLAQSTSHHQIWNSVWRPLLNFGLLIRPCGALDCEAKTYSAGSCTRTQRASCVRTVSQRTACTRPAHARRAAVAAACARESLTTTSIGACRRS